jgi:hypothetical protein
LKKPDNGKRIPEVSKEAEPGRKTDKGIGKRI